MLDVRDVKVDNAKKKIKEMASTSGKTSRTVLAESTAGLPPQVLAQMPSYDSSANTIRNLRKGSRPAVPLNLNELEFPNNLKNIANDNGEEEQFILHDSGTYTDSDGNNKRLIIISTQRNLDFLEECETMHMDGTFDTCPTLFKQLYVIQGMHLIGNNLTQSTIVDNRILAPFAFLD